MGFFDSYPDDEYLTNLFNRTDSEALEALERVIVERGESFLDHWKKAHEAVVRKWLAALDPNVVNLLKAIGLCQNVFYLEQRWRSTGHSRVPSGRDRHEDISAENRYYIDMSTYNFGPNSQLNQAINNSSITATQNNNPNMAELQTLIDKLLAAVPKDTPEAIKNQIKESAETIQAEMQSPAPKQGMIKTVLAGLKNGVVKTVEFAAALASLAQFLGF